MEKEELQKLIDEGLSIRMIVRRKSVSYSTIRYWLKKYNIKKRKKESKDDNVKICKICKVEKEIIDFFKKDNNRYHTYCKKCSTIYHKKRLSDIKIKMILYKGGKCENCKLSLENSHYSVFDFHHIDPNQKDPKFTGIKSRKWEKIENEINKCKLLCSNCHRMEHALIGKWGDYNWRVA